MSAGVGDNTYEGVMCTRSRSGGEGRKSVCLARKNERLIVVLRRPVHSGFTAIWSGEAGGDMTVGEDEGRGRPGLCR